MFDRERPPKERKRWFFMAAAEYLATRTNGEAHLHLNPAGAARLMVWAVRRIQELELLDWDHSQSKHFVLPVGADREPT